MKKGTKLKRTAPMRYEVDISFFNEKKTSDSRNEEAKEECKDMNIDEK